MQSKRVQALMQNVENERFEEKVYNRRNLALSMINDMSWPSVETPFSTNLDQTPVHRHSG